MLLILNDKSHESSDPHIRPNDLRHPGHLASGSLAGIRAGADTGKD